MVDVPTIPEFFSTGGRAYMDRTLGRRVAGDRVIKWKTRQNRRVEARPGAARDLLRGPSACMRRFAVALSLLFLTGCGDDSPGVDESGSPTLIPPGSTNGANPGTNPGTTGTNPGTTGGTSADAQLDEVVYVLIGSFNGGEGGGFCTGTLVAKDIVLTAGHCVDTDRMADFEVVAPRAANQPRVTASRVARFDGDYDDPSFPDIGILKLDEPIVLSQYAQITDVSAGLEGGKTLDAMAVVRTAEEPEAPLESSAILKVSSAKGLGYDYGFQTPLFSHGGDSGAGLFLVENGKRTHKLIGVARQPEPDRDIDHFTGISPTIAQWFKDASTNDDD
jgi:hypothetical protein